MQTGKGMVGPAAGLLIKRPIYLILFCIFILEMFFPVIIKNLWTLRIFMFANIFVIFAIAYDIMSGYTGQISFGHSLFFGGAGYTSGLLSLHFQLPLPVTILAGLATALIFGVILGYVCLRLKGIYLAVVTLICPFVIMTILHLSPTALGGDNGIAGFAHLAGGSLRSQFYIVLFVTTISLFILLILGRGNFGLILQTIREDEIGAEAAGVNIAKYKMQAFIISGLFSGLAGALFVHIIGSVGPTTLSLHYAAFPVTMIFLGGASSIIGPAIGAYIITFLDLYLLSVPYVRVIIYAAIIILVLRFFPGGLIAVPKEIGRFIKWLSLKSRDS